MSNPLSDEAFDAWVDSVSANVEDAWEGWQECARRARDSEEEWELTCESLTEENKRLRDALARCNAFNALDCLEAKQADKQCRAVLKGKE